MKISKMEDQILSDTLKQCISVAEDVVNDAECKHNNNNND